MILEPGIYRCLSVWQPWAWAIFHGKPIENRGWATDYRGRLLIHASKTTRAVEETSRLLSMEFKLVIPARAQLHFGCILGIVELYDCKWSTKKSACGWGVEDAYHWHLRNQQLLDDPIPYRGQQNFFRYVHSEKSQNEKTLL